MIGSEHTGHFPAGFSISFGREPRTILYEDARGGIAFEFRLHRGGYGRYERWLVEVHEVPASEVPGSEPFEEASLARSDLIRRRVREFLVQKGYWLVPKL